MSRNLTAEEKNKLKNLQVSNSIYRRDINDLLIDIAVYEEKLKVLREKEKVAVLDEQLQLSRTIEQFEAEVGRKTGQLKHKEGRIAAKTAEIEEIIRLSMTREDQVVESYNPNDPAILAAKAEAAAKKEAAKPKKEKKEKKEAAPKEPKPKKEPKVTAEVQ